MQYGGNAKHGAQRGRSLPVYITRSEAHRMFAAARNGRDGLFLRLLWHTGGRVSEVLRARVSDLTPNGIRLVNLKQGEWVQRDGRAVFVTDPSAEKHVFLHPAFLDELRAAVVGLPLSALIVAKPGGAPFTRQRAEQIVRQAAIDADVHKRRRIDGPLRPASPHLFRHGAAVNLLRQGVMVTSVQRQLGHASLSSTQVYTQVTDADLERQIAGVEY